mgnify:CR=1 FL=1
MRSHRRQSATPKELLASLLLLTSPLGCVERRSSRRQSATTKKLLASFSLLGGNVPGVANRLFSRLSGLALHLRWAAPFAFALNWRYSSFVVGLIF